MQGMQENDQPLHCPVSADELLGQLAFDGAVYFACHLFKVDKVMQFGCLFYHSELNPPLIRFNAGNLGASLL